MEQNNGAILQHLPANTDQTGHLWSTTTARYCNTSQLTQIKQDTYGAQQRGDTATPASWAPFHFLNVSKFLRLNAGISLLSPSFSQNGKLQHCSRSNKLQIYNFQHTATSRKEGHFRFLIHQPHKTQLNTCAPQ